MFLKKTVDPIISLVFSKENIMYCWIEASSNNHYCLKSYQTIPVTNYALLNGKIYNFSLLKNSLQSFIADNKLRNAWIVCALEGKEIVEDFIELPRATPTRSDFRATKLDRLVWDYQYLFAKEDGLFSFYIAGIPQSVLLQYKLLLTSSGLLPLAITTTTMAHLHLYQTIYASAFRTSQLASDLQKHNYQLIHYFSPEIVRRLLVSRKYLPLPHNNASVSTALGLFLLGKKLYEQH